MNKSLPFRCALITGASSGIGEAFAKELAQRGIVQLILVARSGEKLEKLSQLLQQDFSIKVHWISQDLAETSAPEALLAEIEKLGWEVDCLINNAGFTIRTEDEFEDSIMVMRMIQLMATTPVILCQRLGSAMAKRKKGFILNVSSIVGCFPVATTLSYCAIKRFLNTFSHSLSYEWRSEGVRVSCLQPGATLSSFHEVNQLSLPKKLLPFFRNPAQVAKIGIKGLIKGKRDIIPGFENLLLFLLSHIIPHSWIYLLHKRYWRKLSRGRGC